MPTQRIDSNFPASAPVEGPKPSRPAPATPFASVLGNSANALISGAQTASGVVANPVLSAAVRETGNQALAAAVGGGVGGGTGLSPSAASGAVGAGDPGGLSQMYAMQKESQAFNLQLLNLQQDVQDENRRFTTVSNCMKAAHDTASAAVHNLHS